MKLIADKALQSVHARFAVDLHPSKSYDVRAGIREQLNSQLLRYSEDFEGVALSYSSERVLSAQARIHPYFPYFHVEVEADVLVFKPQPGQAICGTVHKIGSDYIGLLVLGIFNAVITRDLIRDEFGYQGPLDSCWQSSESRQHAIKEGSDVRFHVQRLQHEADFFSLVGSLMGSRTGVLEHIRKTSRDEPDKHGSRRKSKKLKERQSAPAALATDGSAPPERKKHKAK